MPEESESKPSRRATRQAARKKQPTSARLSVFVTEATANEMDREAEFNKLSISEYLRILISRGRWEIKAEAEARAAEAASAQPEDALAAARRKAEEDRRLVGWRDSAQSKALRRGTLMPRGVR